MSRKKKIKEKSQEILRSPATTLQQTESLLPAEIPAKNYFAIGIHATRNLLADPKQRNLFSDPEETATEHGYKYGLKIENEIKEVGVNITDTQLKTIEAILKAFKHSEKEGYTGNIEPGDPNDLRREGKYETLPEAYKNIKQIPRVRLTQSELFRLCGIKENSIAERQRTLDAVKFLGSNQFLFYYKRLVYDKKGKPVRDDKGEYKKEEVTVIDTLFRVKTVTDDKTKSFKYYEIEPTATLLDQTEKYFLLIPHSWREELKDATGGKEISSYTIKFLQWLMLQYEEKRRKSYKNFKIRLSWEEIAQILRMPETLYKRNKKTANKYLLKAYDTAVKTGYLKSYSREPHIDILILNEEKYYNPQGSKEISEE